MSNCQAARECYQGPDGEGTAMVRNDLMTPLLAVIALVLSVAALREASAVFAPLALAIFIIALVWPLQAALETRLPKFVALLMTMAATIFVCLAFSWLVAWGFGRVIRALAADTARLQAVYDSVVVWLEARGISVSGLFAEHFNVRFFIGTLQQVTGRLNTTLGFWVVTFVYVLLGLTEAKDASVRAGNLTSESARQVLIGGAASMAAKFRRYMIVRTQMSVMTGFLVWLFSFAIGLPFAAEWGVIAFALNYIPFLGPLVATVFPTLVAILHFETWQAVILVLAGLNLIQFVIGNWVEPRASGSALSVSPTVVLFSVFFWTWMWGLFGTFIGVPITIAILSFAGEHPATRWIATLFGGAAPARDAA
jgi:predicted PurR-regulated permease PerM